MIKRLIFDVDGTLITGVSFIPPIENVLKRIDAYSEENVKHFFDGIKSYEENFNSYNVHDYLKHMGNLINCELSINELDIFFEELGVAIPSKNEALINTISLLSEKYELVLLTNYFKKSQLNRLNNMGIGHFFTECYGEKIIKPNFEAYMQACGNNKPSECVMIGDDIYLDIETAQKIGLNTIFVNSKNIVNENIKTVTVQSVTEIDENLINVF